MIDERGYRRAMDEVIVKNAAVASFIFHLSSLISNEASHPQRAQPQPPRRTRA